MKLYNEGQSVAVETKGLVFSDGWVHKFLNRNGLSIRRRRTEAQAIPDQWGDRLCAYILKVRRLRNRMESVA